MTSEISKPARKRAPRKSPAPASGSTRGSGATDAQSAATPSRAKAAVNQTGWIYDEETNELRFVAPGGEGK